MSDVENEGQPVQLEFPLLRRLEKVEIDLLKVIWSPIVRAREEGWNPTWPVWDFVVRTMLKEIYNCPDPIEILRGLPSIYRAGNTNGTYGLIWIENNDARSLSGPNKVGLTIAGFTQLAMNGELDQPVHDKLVEIIRDFAVLEEDLEPSPSKSVESVFMLDVFTNWFTQLSESKPYVIPTEVVTETLQREYAHIFIGQSAGSRQVWLNELQLRQYRNIASAHDYLAQVAFLAQSSYAPQLAFSPLTLVQTIDYLSYVLSAHPKWGSKERFITITDLQSATSFMTPVNSQEEFISRMNGIWNVINQFTVPAIPQDILQEKYSGKPQGSIAKLDYWLSSNLDEVSRDRVSRALAQIRAIRKIRVAEAHGSQSTRAQAIEAHRLLSLPDFISDWTMAWDTVRERLAWAFDVIREEVQVNSILD